MTDTDHPAVTDGEQVEVWPVGSRPYFEYHCWESPQSLDAPAWRRSHQRVTVLAVEENDSAGMTRAERDEAAMPFTYQVRFPDGVEWTAFEDELLASADHYTRPAPPAVESRGDL